MFARIIAEIAIGALIGAILMGAFKDLSKRMDTLCKQQIMCGVGMGGPL